MLLEERARGLSLSVVPTTVQQYATTLSLHATYMTQMNMNADTERIEISTRALLIFIGTDAKVSVGESATRGGCSIRKEHRLKAKEEEKASAGYTQGSFGDVFREMPAADDGESGTHGMAQNSSECDSDDGVGCREADCRNL